MDGDGDVGGFASLALDPLARQRAAYYDWNAGAVRLAALDIPVVAHKSFETVTSGLRSANIIVRVDSSAASLVEVVLQKKAGNQFVPATSDPPPLLASPGLPADPVLLGPGPFRIALRTRLNHLVLGFSEQFDFPPPDTVFNGQKRPQDVVLSGTIRSLDGILAAS